MFFPSKEHCIDCIRATCKEARIEDCFGAFLGGLGPLRLLRGHQHLPVATARHTPQCTPQVYHNNFFYENVRGRQTSNITPPRRQSKGDSGPFQQSPN
jgi:hypothetical protein